MHSGKTLKNNANLIGENRKKSYQNKESKTSPTSLMTCRSDVLLKMAENRHKKSPSNKDLNY